MPCPLHVVPSTTEFDALIQIRTAARFSSEPIDVICLEDVTNNLEALQQWIGSNAIVTAPRSQSPWLRTVQLVQLTRRFDRNNTVTCWDPAKFGLEALPMLRRFRNLQTVITTPSKRNLTYPGVVGNFMYQQSHSVSVSSRFLESQIPNSQFVPSLLLPIDSPDVNETLELRTEFNLSNSSQIILCLGNNESFVRIKEAIWIVGILEHLHQDIHLVICGDGSQTDILRQYADHMVLRPRIHFLTPWIEPASLFPQIQCLLVTADHQGKDWGLQQAIQQQVAVVASRSDGNNECIQHEQNGFLGGPDAGGLAKYIHQILLEPTVFPDRPSADCTQNTPNPLETVFNQ